MRRYYYLDASIGEDFDGIFKRTQSWAASAANRLDDPNDLDFRDVFQIIFKTSVTDTQPMPRSPDFQSSQGQGELQPIPVIKHVRRELRSLAYDWVRTYEREEAEVRIHRDGIKRYVQRGPARFYDPVNGMLRIDSNWEENLHWMWSKWNAFVILTRQEGDPEHQNPQRNVIEFTENAKINWGHLAEADLHGDPVGCVMGGLLEHILIHEMMHCEAYGLLDFYTELGCTSSWDLVAGLTKRESYICAESIAILCLAAALADSQPVGRDKTFKYTVSKDGRIRVVRRRA